MLQGQREGTQTPARSGLLANACGCVACAEAMGPRGKICGTESHIF